MLNVVKQSLMNIFLQPSLICQKKTNNKKKYLTFLLKLSYTVSGINKVLYLYLYQKF